MAQEAGRASTLSHQQLDLRTLLASSLGRSRLNPLFGALEDEEEGVPFGNQNALISALMRARTAQPSLFSQLSELPGLY